MSHKDETVNLLLKGVSEKWFANHENKDSLNYQVDHWLSERIADLLAVGNLCTGTYAHLVLKNPDASELEVIFTTEPNRASAKVKHGPYAVTGDLVSSISALSLALMKVRGENRPSSAISFAHGALDSDKGLQAAYDAFMAALNSSYERISAAQAATLARIEQWGLVPSGDLATLAPGSLTLSEGDQVKALGLLVSARACGLTPHGAFKGLESASPELVKRSADVGFSYSSLLEMFDQLHASQRAWGFPTLESFFSSWADDVELLLDDPLKWVASARNRQEGHQRAMAFPRTAASLLHGELLKRTPTGSLGSWSERVDGSPLDVDEMVELAVWLVHDQLQASPLADLAPLYSALNKPLRILLLCMGTQVQKHFNQVLQTALGRI